MNLNKKQKQIIYLFAGLSILTPLIAILGLGALNQINKQDQITAPYTKEQGSIKTPTEVVITDPQNNKITIEVEIADTPQERAYGLMNRQHLDENSGMLFIFPDSKMRSFWMKDTYISLDIIFINDQKRIINIKRNTTPLQTYPTYNSISPSMYVLEVNAGFSDRNNLSRGDLVSF